MKLSTKCHFKALSNTIEMSLVASTIALIADVCWLTHDIVTNGMSATYAGVGAGLIAGLIATTVALVGHHRNQVKCDLRIKYVDKLARAAAKLKRSNKTRTH